MSSAGGTNGTNNPFKTMKSQQEFMMQEADEDEMEAMEMAPSETSDDHINITRSHGQLNQQ